jgi:hypothetical protein
MIAPTELNDLSRWQVQEIPLPARCAAAKGLFFYEGKPYVAGISKRGLTEIPPVWQESAAKPKLLPLGKTGGYLLIGSTTDGLCGCAGGERMVPVEWTTPDRTVTKLDKLKSKQGIATQGSADVIVGTMKVPDERRLGWPAACGALG